MRLPAEEYRFSTRPGALALDEREFQASVYDQQYGRIPNDGRDADADFLVASDGTGRLAASARVLTADHRPFSFDSVLDVRSISGVGGSPAEIGRWCIREDLRDVIASRGLLFGMMKLVYLFARVRSVSAYVMYVYPDLERFYRGLFFEDSGVGFDHPDWGRVRMYYLPLERFEAQLATSGTSLAQYLLAPIGANFVIGKR